MKDHETDELRRSYYSRVGSAAVAVRIAAIAATVWLVLQIAETIARWVAAW